MLQHRLARRAATVSFIDKALGHRWNATEHNESGRYDRCGHQLVGHRRLLLPTSQPERGAAGIEIQVPADRRKRPRYPWPRPRVDQGAPRRYESSSPLIPRRHGGHLRGVHDAGGAGGRHWSILGRVPLLLSSHGATGREFPPVDVLTSRCHRRHRLPPRPPLPPKTCEHASGCSGRSGKAPARSRCSIAVDGARSGQGTIRRLALAGANRRRRLAHPAARAGRQDQPPKIVLCPAWQKSHTGQE
jgi:hypothetical protein